MDSIATARPPAISTGPISLALGNPKSYDEKCLYPTYTWRSTNQVRDCSGFSGGPLMGRLVFHGCAACCSASRIAKPSDVGTDSTAVA